MNIKVFLENETEISFAFSADTLAESVIQKVLEVEKCPYNSEVNILITDNNGIKEYNSQMRGIDTPTDVLSFPNLNFDAPSVFTIEPGLEASYLNPETQNIVLGDIILNAERVYSQAEEYGHSIRREFAFLIAHSMYHLCGYDHMTKEEADEMEAKQEAVLHLLRITRDSN